MALGIVPEGVNRMKKRTLVATMLVALLSLPYALCAQSGKEQTQKAPEVTEL